MILRRLQKKLSILGKYCGDGSHFELAMSNRICTLRKYDKRGHDIQCCPFDNIESAIAEINRLVELTDTAHNPTGNWWFE